MRDWNVVATTHDRGYRHGSKLLSAAGRLWRTEFYNVLVMKVDDIDAFLSWLERQWSDDDAFRDAVAHVRPLRETLNFQSLEEFEEKAIEVAVGLVPRLGSKSFHVRAHRRGFKARLSTPAEERRLADAVLERQSSQGIAGWIAFDDPDAILAVETVGNRGGMSLWERHDLRRYPFLGLD